MDTTRVLVVIGTRPEAIKLAPVIHELRRRSQDCQVRPLVCVTAQHRQLLDPMLDLFGIVPDYDLDVMEPDQTPAGVAAAILRRLEPILAKEKPDWVVVQGDTTNVAAAALAACYAGRKVAHVEAGLRTHDKRQPFPEEMNRRVAGVLTDLHFAPTEGARRNLLREGVDDAAIVVTGNPGIDALQWIARHPPTQEAVDLLARIGMEDGKGPSPRVPRLILATAHRRENFGERLDDICRGLRDVAERYGTRVRIVYPVHLNPHVRDRVERLLGDVTIVTLTPPLDYPVLVHLMRRAYFILTDSGGIQEEAPSLGVPVLVLRDVTERLEGVEAGVARLVGTNRHRILTEASRLLDDLNAHRKMAHTLAPYGDGRAAHRIVAALLGENIERFRPGASELRRGEVQWSGTRNSTG